MRQEMWIACCLFCIGILSACSDKSRPMSFEDFYERFHSDSTYQMDHILFPMDGIPPMADSTFNEAEFQWTMENWRLHRAFDFQDSDYEQQLDTFGEDVVVETIRHRSGKFGMMRRFARMDGEWYLIYCADMNPIKGKKSGIKIEGGF